MNVAWQQELISIFNGAPISKLFGMTLAYDEQGHTHVYFPYNPNLDHPGGIHGGIVATLLDTAGWFAVAAQSETLWVTTGEFKINFLNPAQKCDLHAEGWVVKDGKRISVSEMRVSTSDGEIVAIGTGSQVFI